MLFGDLVHARRVSGVRRGMRAAVWAALVTVAAAARVVAAEAAPDVRSVLDRFLHAYESRNLAMLAGTFAEDATLFFPAPSPPERFEGRSAIVARFEQVFERQRGEEAAGTRRPNQYLEPEDVRVDALGSDTALVTFQVRFDSRVGRRTFVFRCRDGAWQIFHLHASNSP